MAGADVPVRGGRGGRRVSIHIDMTPMVDVIILLLIFFFMTSQFKEPAAVEVTLPAAERTAPLKVPETNVLTVKVDETGKVFVVDIYNRDGTEVTLDELGKYIGSRQQDNDKLITIIDVSPEAEYSRMMDVLDEFKIASEETGVRKISLQLEELGETAATAEAGG
jgi:biopolymer transport protein ExbD